MCNCVSLNGVRVNVPVADVSLMFLTPLFQPPGPRRLLTMFFDSSVFPDNTIVVVVAQFSVAAAGFVLRLRSMIHVRLVSGAVDSRLRCRRRRVVVLFVGRLAFLCVCRVTVDFLYAFSLRR